MGIITLIARAASALLGALLAFVGSVWALQGAGVIGNSPMTGQPTFIAVGAVLALIGLALLWLAWKRPRLAFVICGTLLSLMGGIWFLQGFNLFPGESFMNGDLRWSLNGAIAILIGGGLILLGRRRVSR